MKSIFSGFPAPLAEKRPVTETHHGMTRIDNYAWLRASNWQEVLKDPSALPNDIRKHLEAENVYQSLLMADTKLLQEKLFQEMRGRIKEDDSSVPFKDGPFAYGFSYKKGGQQPHYFRVAQGSSEKTIILDGDAEAEGHEYFRLASVVHSHDHRKLLWAFDNKGSEFYTLKVRDLETGLDDQDSVPGAKGHGVWTADSSAFVYVQKNESSRPSKLFLHRLGTPATEDVLLFEETDTSFFVSVSGTRDKQSIIVSVGGHETSESYVISAAAPTDPPRLVSGRLVKRLYTLASGGDTFFILTNADGATDFKIMAAPATNPGLKNWSEVVPHEPGRLIVSVMAFAHFLVWLERQDGLPRIIVRHRASGDEHTIGFDEEAHHLSMGSDEYATETIRLYCSSMKTPWQTFDYNMRTRDRVLLKTQEVPSGYNPDEYVTQRLTAPAYDGELIPLSLLYRKGTPLDGSAPCRICGYGSYGTIYNATFDSTRLSLVDRGFVDVIAHVRGGKEKGHAWYEDSKRANKTNTFKDFITVANYLVAQRFTSHQLIVAQGASAGGMLMGAVANIAPEAFGAIIAEVPFVDVLATMLDETLPLTPIEWPELGNPIALEDDYQIIASYSPFDNVVAQAYPPILATTGLTDLRVTYWEAAKWVAQLRDLKTDSNPVLCKINMLAGHSGASGRFSSLEETAFILAFAVKAVGRGYSSDTACS